MMMMCLTHSQPLHMFQVLCLQDLVDIRRPQPQPMHPMCNAAMFALHVELQQGLLIEPLKASTMRLIILITMRYQQKKMK